MKASSRGGEAATDELAGESDGQSMEHEPEWLQVLDGRFDREAERESLGAAPWAERFELLATGPGVDPGSLLAEPGDERRPWKLGHGADPAQTESNEPGADVRVCGQEARRMRGKELGIAARGDEDGCLGPGDDCSDRGAEPRPRDARPDATRRVIGGGAIRGRAIAAGDPWRGRP